MTLREPPKEQRAANIIGRFVGLVVLLALFAVTVWATATNQQAAAVERTDPLVHAPGEYVAVASGAIHHVVVGSGDRPIAFVHPDTIAGGATFGSLARSVAEGGRRVLLPDLIGFGFSSRPGEPGRSLSTSGQAESLGRYLDELGEGPLDLVGFGWGGEVASELAVLRPDLLSSLTLVDTPELPLPGAGLHTLEGMPFGLGQAVSYTFEGAGGPAEDRFREECPSWAECAGDEVEELRLRAASVPGTARTIRARRASPAAFVAPGRLDEVTVPVTIVAVDLEPSRADSLAGDFPDAEAVSAGPEELAPILADRGSGNQ